jgi:hypothetical protein
MVLVVAAFRSVWMVVQETKLYKTKKIPPGYPGGIFLVLKGDYILSTSAFFLSYSADFFMSALAA